MTHAVTFQASVGVGAPVSAIRRLRNDELTVVDGTYLALDDLGLL